MAHAPSTWTSNRACLVFSWTIEPYLILASIYFDFLNLFPNRLWSKLKPKFKFLRYSANYPVNTDHVTFDDTLIYCSKSWRPNTNESNPNASEKTFYGKIQIFKLFNRQCFTIKRRHSHFNGNAFQKLYKRLYSSTMANSLTLFQAKWVNFWTYFSFRITKRLTNSVQKHGVNFKEIIFSCRHLCKFRAAQSINLWKAHYNANGYMHLSLKKTQNLTFSAYHYTNAGRIHRWRFENFLRRHLQKSNAMTVIGARPVVWPNFWMDFICTIFSC